MKNNSQQIKGKSGEKLPIVSDKKEIQRNSMRLYVYLVSISNFGGIDKPRILDQKDISPTKISNLLKMKPGTIKKYWSILESNGLIKYEGKTDPEFTWSKMFQIRKKDKTAYYTIPKKTPYRIMPKETLLKIQNEYCVSEEELKMYLRLAEMQEQYCYMGTPCPKFTLADLRDLLQLKSEKKTNDILCRRLSWLKTLKLIDYEVIPEKNNLGKNVFVARLIIVNYYTDGGEVGKMLTSSEEKFVSNEMKEKILNNTVIEIFEE